MPCPKILLGRSSYTRRVESIWALHIIVFTAVLFISLQPTKAQALHDDSIKAIDLYLDGNCAEALPLLKKAEEEQRIKDEKIPKQKKEEEAFLKAEE